jgi:hypothetical protein
MGHARAQNCIGKNKRRIHIFRRQQRAVPNFSAWLFRFLLEAALMAWLVYIEGGGRSHRATVRFSTWLYIREGGSAVRDLAVSMLTSTLRIRFHIRLYIRGAIEKITASHQLVPKNAKCTKKQQNALNWT